METLKFNTSIKASREKVWQVLWNDDTYRKWTAVFCEGSHAESDWKEGSEIKFLGPDGSGMFSIIETKIPNEQMSFRHLGELKNGVKETKDWDGAMEKYFLTEADGTTELRVEIGMNEEYVKYFADIFPKALEIVKQLSETD
jgi:uncharacterized protein YndB with AHSA1/START domain